MQNVSCPITLDPLVDKPPQEIFVHMDFGFDMAALYEYLMTAPELVNPINRAPFTIQELERLESQMETVFGEGCIYHQADVPPADTESNDDGSEEKDHDDNDDDDDDNDGINQTVDWLDDTELIARLSTSIVDITTESNDRLIRLRVDIDMDDVVPSSGGVVTPDATMPPHNRRMNTIPEDEEVEDEFMHVPENALPPRRTFPSVTDMLRDPDRTARISDRLSLLQYLEYDAMAILVHMLDMAYDNHFHRFVWQHTCLDVIDAVTSYLSNGSSETEDAGETITRITEPSPSATIGPADYDLEVIYTECWEVYRHIILDTLERRYAETAQDILNISTNDFRALFHCHRTHVRQKSMEQGVDYHVVLEALQKIEHQLLPSTGV